MKTENIVVEKSFAFSLRMIKLYKYLERKGELVLSRQLLRSGTSISANLEEALGASSKKDFLAKISISYKEARESKLWIRLLKESKILSDQEATALLEDCEELLRLLGTIQKTTKFQINAKT